MDKDRFTYEDGDVVVKDSYCDFCLFCIKNESDKCVLYKDGKPSEILERTVICDQFTANVD